MSSMPALSGAISFVDIGGRGGRGGQQISANVFENCMWSL